MKQSHERRKRNKPQLPQVANHDIEEFNTKLKKHGFFKKNHLIFNVIFLHTMPSYVALYEILH